ncbi:NAD-dependent succinate-semialdehyde dehydrogenase [Legionella waltersii]|uniref:Succinate semialdehyde dehydrogenase n=1 Tax=Legionella waltersii TaxID=66969 RepID=A0A0W1A106_9GAMM|nr:NAD-dependent succinate-semialdehyde dehydrogenase [Legionella waltersii]KTD75019.1 succinate semialdehyde dehydrogenase [Legionella waltersii]SNV05522.1 succinate semialdehyde dehydrogenase [Legionella waltersii]
MEIQTINPTTEEVIHTYTCLTSEQIKERILRSQEAYLEWKKFTFDRRKVFMLNLAEILRSEKDELAILMATEMGKPITAGRAEIEKCAGLCEHYAEHAEEYLQPRIIKTEMKKSKVCYQPLGIVFAIMPWNFPFWQVFRFSVPTLMSGNAAVLKHAPISSGTGNKIEELYKRAGFPEGLFQHLIVDNEGAAEIIENEHVIAVTLTGSERAGKSVATTAGKQLKKSVLELGGSDPYVVLEDADLSLASSCIVASRLNNTGQVCIAAKRIIAVKSVVPMLIDKIKEKMSTYTMGNPLEATVQIGPMARKDLRDELHAQVEKSIKQGAKLLLGGIIPTGKGYFYPPTLLVNVKPGMTAFEEELFGPVLVIITAEDEKNAIQLANLTKYGLGAAVFTQDLSKGEHIATYELEAGVCFVNALVASDPRLPFGGIKKSGYGRELSREGILEFVNTKTVSINESR